MKILTNLSATPTEGVWDDPRANLQVIHDEPAPGFFRQVTLGEAGVIVKRGKAQVAFPIAELLRLAAQHESSLVPPAK